MVRIHPDPPYSESGDERHRQTDRWRLSGCFRRAFCRRAPSGREYGTNGDGFLRLNVATRRANVEDGMHRLKKSVEDFVRQREYF